MTPIEQVRMLEKDHSPDGWPAVQMKVLTTLADELENIRAENKQLRELCKKADRVLSKVRTFQRLNLEEKWLDDLERAGGEVNNG